MKLDLPYTTDGNDGANGNCPLCVYKATPHLRLQHTWVMLCSNPACRLMFASPQLEDKALDAAYRKYYYPAPAGVLPPHANTPGVILREILEEFFAKLWPFAGNGLLDFGCGAGALCRVASEYGARAIGIESDANAREMAKKTGCKIFASLDNLREVLPDAKFDIVTMWEVVEHLRQPWRELQQLSALLEPDGWLLITTPNAGSLRAILERGRWLNMVNPTHFYYFTRRSLQMVLKRGGFNFAFELDAPVNYRHSPLRRFVHQVLVSRLLHGQLLFLAQPATSTTESRMTRSP